MPSFTRKVKFPITDHAAATGIAHSILFESEYSRVGLAPQAGSILARNWGLRDQNDFSVVTRGAAPVGNVTHDIANYILKFTAGTDVISCVWNIGADLRAVYARVRATVASNFYSGVILRALISNPEAGVAAVFNNTNGKFSIHDAGVGIIISSSASYSLNTWYRFYLSINGTALTFKIYNDSDSLIETLSTTLPTYATNVYGGIWAHTRDLECSWAMFGTNTEDLIKNYYSTASPSPATAWTALQAGDVVDMSTAKAWMYKDGVVQAAGNTDVTFKYAANGGSDSTAKTLTQLRAETDVTVTNDTNSFKIYGLYASNGAYKSESETWIEFNVVSAAGGGGSYLLDGGLIR